MSGISQNATIPNTTMKSCAFRTLRLQFMFYVNNADNPRRCLSYHDKLWLKPAKLRYLYYIIQILTGVLCKIPYLLDLLLRLILSSFLQYTEFSLHFAYIANYRQHCAQRNPPVFGLLSGRF